jgi:signal transduction histidine kinase
VRTSAFLVERKLLAANPGTEAQFRRISQGVERCDAIITQLLDFARTRQLDLKPVDLDSWLEQLLQEEAQSCSEKVSITCNLGLNGALVSCDAARLSRAVSNVISNACEAMVGKLGHGAAVATFDPRLEITTFLTARGVEISFKDNGSGMSPDVLKRIREPLFTTKNFGTGLGVPAIEKILEQHGGGVEIESEPGQGAKFTLWWPDKVEAQQAA